MGGDPVPWIVANALVRRFGPLPILVEDGEPRSVFLKRRLRLLGFLPVAGQVAFGLLMKALSKCCARRRSEIIDRHGLDPRPIEGAGVRHVGSVNSEACRAALRRIAPRVVVVLGTRIIKGATLAAIAAPFVNYHAGINPKYRGQHGLYWALAEGDREHGGVTIHLVDEGVDTGSVLYQTRVDAGPADSIMTYQYLQAAAAIPLLARAIEDALEGRLTPKRIGLPSRQWFHPTLWQYALTGIVRGVW